MIREKATPQELADRFQGYVVMDEDETIYLYNNRPECGDIGWWGSGGFHRLDLLFDIDYYYTDHWKDSLHSPQHLYMAGERVLVWNNADDFAQVRKFRDLKYHRIYTCHPILEGVTWDNHRQYDETLPGVPIAEWPEV